MRVFLPLGAAFQRGRYRCCSFDVLGLDDVGGGARAAVAGIDELDDARSGDEAERSEIEQAAGSLELALLDVETVFLQNPEHLLDAPAQAIEAHHVLGIRKRGNGQCRDKAPQQRLTFPSALLLLARPPRTRA